LLKETMVTFDGAQRDININTTKTTTMCTDYTCRKQACTIRLAITSAPMKYTGD